MNVSVIIARKENKGKFRSSFSFAFAGFDKGHSGESPPHWREMADQNKAG